ncbi:MULTISPECIES: hypothetical protein [unclassified Sphingomonas]|uniref:hypothetical protein n=1 Tax=unclassified Sphingomonas TaxID=196159 RepID=UPI0006F77109|nr:MULTISPECIES: hypothetical protein [unclassified Sphingomonas]KQX22714.1 hypothetical protein ASD17_05360 [Sphingomonas sp. Root1294]KQY67805.1 hypothetical protein ASD39_07765 [Sphingomonas sp. Root50]KRB88729.1 hypothetical protein ASE22_20115 [Sphingomonas sp. Root720]
MRRLFTKLVAALAVTSAVAAAVPAEARDRGGYGRDGHRWDGDRRWRGDRSWRGDRGWRGDRNWRGDRWGGRGYGYYPPVRYRYAPRYYGYGYGYPRGGYYHRDRGGDALIGAIAGIAIGAAIAGAD